MRIAGVSVTNVDGRTALGAPARARCATALGGMTSKGRKIPGNLGEIACLDSSAIGELAWPFTTVSRQGAH